MDSDEDVVFRNKRRQTKRVLDDDEDEEMENISPQIQNKSQSVPQKMPELDNKKGQQRNNEKDVVMKDESSKAKETKDNSGRQSKAIRSEITSTTQRDSTNGYNNMDDFDGLSVKSLNNKDSADASKNELIGSIPTQHDFSKQNQSSLQNSSAVKSSNQSNGKSTQNNGKDIPSLKPNSSQQKQTPIKQDNNKTPIKKEESKIVDDKKKVLQQSAQKQQLQHQKDKAKMSPQKKKVRSPSESSGSDDDDSNSGSESGSSSGSGSGSSSGSESDSGSNESSSYSDYSNEEQKQKIERIKQLKAIKQKLQDRQNNKQRQITVQEKAELLRIQAEKILKEKKMKEKSIKSKQIRKEEKVKITKEQKNGKEIVSVKKVIKKVKTVMQTQVTEEELNFLNKQHLIEEISVRWNYVLPPWPPANYDYGYALKQNNLRRVELKNWKMEPEEKDGLKKVFELETFSGYFKDSMGNSYDLRPRELCPSLNNFERMDKGKLQNLLLQAYENQLRALEAIVQPHDHKQEQHLKAKLKKKITRLSGQMGVKANI
ncbi:UNKNOWN [Stylonychia lemnae]|uniref:Uncharacterized protein n=1 Tax=Stylonychia lemnae TaxID=5949 RepID=A0A078AVY0_STYLE|nr:UNKNOWN [Stylonychia lemnae]|eukprot:CDW86334.1 UNKNOWN [Stylonychia lemnae]